MTDLAAADGAVARVAVLDPARTRVLLVREGARWALPSVGADGLWFETGAVADALEASPGLPVFVQRCLAGDDNERPSAERLYAGPPVVTASLRIWGI